MELPIKKAINLTTAQHQKATSIITSAASEDRKSEVRQRCGCNITPSCAQSRSAPRSRSRVEDVHSIEEGTIVDCAKRETRKHAQHTARPIVMRATQKKRRILKTAE